MRLLDLQRRLPRARAATGPPSADATGNPIQPEWGFAWPHNRRVLYNRASADPEGRPWSERKKLIWWDDEQRRWVGLDRPRLRAGQAARLSAPRGGRPAWRPSPARQPFIMKPDGLGWLFAPGGVKDGPLPTHYEPVESPVGNLLYPRQTCTPGVRTFEGPLNRARAHADGRVSRRRHHVPPDRALPERADEPVQRLAQRAPAGDVRRAEPGAGRRARDRARRLADGAVAARPHRGPRDGDPPDTAPPGRRAASIHQIGLPFHWAFAGEIGRRQRQRPDLAGRRPQREHARGEGVHLPGRAPAAATAADPGPTVRPSTWPTRAPIPDTPPRPSRRGSSLMAVRELELSALRTVGRPARRTRCRRPGSGSSTRSAASPRPSRTADRLLHRHHRLHRLQGLRGRLQAVEPDPRRRIPTGPATATTTPRSCRPRPGGTSSSSSSSPTTAGPRGRRRRAPPRRHALDVRGAARRGRIDRRGPRPLADDERRLQALRRRPLPARLPDRRDHLQRVRQRLHPAGYLQRLLVLRRGLPVRRDHPQRPRRPLAQVHALLRPPARRPGPGLRQGLPDGLDPVRPDRRAAPAGRGAGRGAAPTRRARGLPVWRRAPSATYSELHSFYLLVDRPSTYGLPEVPFNPWLHMQGDYSARSPPGWSRSPRSPRAPPPSSLRTLRCQSNPDPR